MLEWMRTISSVLPLIGLAAVADLQGQEAGNPACSLLTAADLKQATGQNYDEASPGDEMGEGAGGGASCQWGDPGSAGLPMVSVVLIPSNGKKSYTEVSRSFKAQPGCVREPVSGLGDGGFVESCTRARGPVVRFKKGANDALVQLDARKSATPASVKSTAIALAKAVATHMP
jgi:hypothetical protein